MSEPAAAQRLPTSSWLVLALVALTLLLFTKDRPNSWADGTRLGTIQGLVEHGTLALDETDYLWQGDKIRIGEHFYSHQPPMLAMIGALPYWVLHSVFGRGIDDSFTYRILTWVLVGLPAWLGLWALARLLAGCGCGPRWAAVWLALAFFGTLLLPYSLVLNQHGAAAGLCLVALLAVARRRPGSAGVLLALASTIDLTAMFWALACAWPVWRADRVAGLLRYGLCALPVLALHFGVNYALLGDLVPPGLHLEAFEYPLSPFMLMSLTGSGADEVAGTQGIYIWGALFGQSGLFSHHPVLLVAVLAALGLALGRRRPASEVATPGLLVAVGLASLGIAAYYLTQSRNFGGSCFGMRWFAVFAPALVLFPATWLGAAPPGARTRPVAAGCLALLALWSVGAASLGAVRPWAKFYYLPSQTPDAALAEPGARQPALVELWKDQWRRLLAWEQPFDRESYERWFEQTVNTYGQLHVKRFPGMDDAAYQAWVRAGFDVLLPVVDQLDNAELLTYARIAGHTWLGNFQRKLRNWSQARLEYRRALALDPNDIWALRGMEKLNEESGAAPQH